MKKIAKGAANLRRYGILMMVAVLLVSLLNFGSVQADATASGVSRLNVMLVIDGSGSLTMNNGTDVKNYRYDAIDLFLALLTNEGNNVGAIVFNHETLLNSPIAPINGKADKVALSQKIRQAGAKGDTNIGAALLSAVEACEAAEKQNGLESVILLFSDGRTDVWNHGGEDAQQKSLEAKEEATVKAQNADIPIHTICLNASSTADPAELEEIATRTSGTFAAVSKAEDLTVAFENFYKLIFPNSANEVTDTTFSADGKLSVEIQAPSYGVEEINVILNTKSVTGTAITAPSGLLSDAQVEDTTMTGGQYRITKLVNPEKGLWKVDLSGTPGTDVKVNILYNIDSAAQMKTADSKTDYGVGDTVTFQTNLLHNGSLVTDPAVTQDYTAKLIVTDLSTDQVISTIDMTPGANGMFSATYTGTTYSSVKMKAELYWYNLTLGSNELQINFGNTAPVAVKNLEVIEQTVTPISGKSVEVDVTQFFTDSQDTKLSYQILSCQLVPGTATLDGNTGKLTVNTGDSRSGDVVIQATDSLGATAQMTVRFDVTNLTWLIFGSIIAAILIGLAVIIALIVIKSNKPFKGMLTINDINGGIQRTHGGFRGKLTLERLGINSSGIAGGMLVSTGHNRVEFRAKCPIYTTNGYQTDPKKITLSPGFNTVYADETHTMGVEIDLQPSGY